MDIKTIFARHIKSELAKNQITQRELADKLKLPPTTVNSWAQGRTFPHGESLQAVAEILNTTPSKLVADDRDDYQVSDSDKYMLLAINSSDDRRRLVDLCLKMPDENVKSAISILNTVCGM